MKELIHKLLISESEGFKSSSEGDWEWAKDTPLIKLGAFEMDDVSFDEDDEAKVTVLTDKVIYRMDDADDLSGYINENIEDDWMLKTLLDYGGYDESYYPSELDNEEINYILPHNISDEQIKRVDEVLNSEKVKKLISEKYPNPRQLDLFNDRYFNQYRKKTEVSTIEQFFKGRISFNAFLENQTVTELEIIFDLIENGLWSEFRNDVIYRAELNLERNRTIEINDTWRNMMDGSRGFEIERIRDRRYGGRHGEEIVITIHEPDFTNNLSTILENGLSDILGFYWGDTFYDTWDYSDEGDYTYIENEFDSFLDGIEKVLEEL